jgi:hypothetical protein
MHLTTGLPRLMPETRNGRTFDWAPRFDPRSLNFRAAPDATELPATGRLWDLGPVLDQGAEGACVGMGCAGAVAAAPSGRSGVSFSYAFNWYRHAQRLDEWHGEAYEGTSVLAGCKVGRERKLWTGFRWAKNPAELAHGIIRDPDDGGGPAIIGVQWSEDLYETSQLGVLPGDVTLNPTMGHCVMLFGYLPAPDIITRELWDQLAELDLVDGVDSLKEPSFLLLNSWGRTYGRGGLAVAPLTLVRRWFAARGEFALPVGRVPARGRKAAAVSETEREQEQERESGTTTEHVTMADVLEGDRILDPPEELGQESATVTAPVRYVSGRRVIVSTTAGRFRISAASPVTVRRSQ